MKNFDVKDHINYTHFVGEVSDIRYIDRNDSSPYCLCRIIIKTEYKENKHQPIEIDVIFWDTLAIAVKDEKIGKGDILNVEGRLTVRKSKSQIFYSITGNKVKVVRQIEGKEPFLHEVGKTSK